MIKLIKENVILFILLVGLLILAGVQVVTFLNKDRTPKTEQVVKESSTSESSSVEEETMDQKNYRRIKLKLEHGYTAASDEQKQQVAEALTKAIEYIQKTENFSDIKGSYENHMMMTDPAMVSTFAMPLKFNQYQYDSSKLEVLQSDNEDVVQFLLVYSKNGADNCFFIGNFNTTVQQLQITNYQGGTIGGTFG